MIEAHRIATKLYIGSWPPANLRDYGFDILVLCAREDQEPRDIMTIHVPLDDTHEPVPRDRVLDAVATARMVHEFREAGARVLVTCQAGVNRSSFVVALALVYGGWTPSGAIERIRERRQPPVGIRPLSNPRFERLVYLLAGKRPPQVRGQA